MIITYKYGLRLTRMQQERVSSWVGACRFVYNMALLIKIDAYQKSVPISFVDLERQIKTIRDIDWIGDVPCDSLHITVQKLKKTYDNFFSQRSGFPKFKSKKSISSIPFKDIKQISFNSFQLPKIGEVKIYKDRQPEGVLKTATIVREVNKYYLHIVCEVETNRSDFCDSQTGIDVGISNFAVMSDGTIIEHPKLLAASQRKLRVAQRKLSRAKKGGANWHKQILVIQKLHEKVKRQRQDFLHKTSSSIIEKNDVVSVENLNIKGMVKSNLSRQISDSGWGYFKQMLKYKSELYSKTFVEVSPIHTSQECFICGHISSENRKTQSEFKCMNCGHENHADHNAAQNILRRGQRLLAQSTDNSLRLAKEPISDVSSLLTEAGKELEINFQGRTK